MKFSRLAWFAGCSALGVGAGILFPPSAFMRLATVRPGPSAPAASRDLALTPPPATSQPQFVSLEPLTSLSKLDQQDEPQPNPASPALVAPPPPETALQAIAHSVRSTTAAVIGWTAANTQPVETASLPSTQLAYAGGAPSGLTQGNPALTPAPPVNVEIPGLREALAAYRSLDLAGGDAHAQRIDNPTARAAAEWAAMRFQPRIDRTEAFLAAHPQWPQGVMRNHIEAALLGGSTASGAILAILTKRPPETPAGRLALVRALAAQGRETQAVDLARRIWREDDLSATAGTGFLKDFGASLTRADHKARADRYAYKGAAAASLRAAVLAGADVVALTKARESLNDKLIAALPAALRKDPPLLLARIQKLRRDKKFAAAGELMLAAPGEPDPADVGDEWWTERRLIARKLLDIGDAAAAYKVAAGHSAIGMEKRLEAEFHAGWIALRFLHDPRLASPHFARMAELARTPQSISRAAYWQGRTAQVQGDAAAASIFFQTAASHQSAYYGQLARRQLGRNDLVMRRPDHIAKGEDRAETVRVVEMLEALDQKDLAAALSAETARQLNDEAQLAALAEVFARAGNAAMTLGVGKIASQRGFALDEPAFPTFGIPAYEPLSRSAEMPMVYAIARQESAFATAARSGAGAKGLMQMLTSTARVTATRSGVAFDEQRLISDAAFNAQLGAAHLADLMATYRGSIILTCAAYNAGGKRVSEWIAAYGDPRDSNVDPVDWIERIPFTETRNYVQRIVENLEMYRVRMGANDRLAIDETIRQVTPR